MRINNKQTDNLEMSAHMVVSVLYTSLGEVSFPLNEGSKKCRYHVARVHSFRTRNKCKKTCLRTQFKQENSWYCFRYRPPVIGNHGKYFNYKHDQST